MKMSSDTAVEIRDIQDGLFGDVMPVIAQRMIHFDLKGVPPTFQRMLELIRLLGKMRFTHVIFEWEDMFPWTCAPQLRNPECYTVEQVQQICELTRSLGMSPVPFVQCLGHMESVLALPEYAHMREVPDETRGLNPLALGVHELLQAMQDDVIGIMGKPEYMFIGGDEAWTLGQHPATQAYIRHHSRNDLFIQHISTVANHLLKQGIRPICAHDMLSECSVEQIARMRDLVDVFVWGYKEHPYQTHLHYRREVIDRLAQAGLKLWGCTSYKAARATDSDYPDYQTRQDNAQAWLEVCTEYQMQGVIVTGWSRYDVPHVQLDPIDASLDCLLNQAAIFYHGEPVTDPLNALEALGELERFTSCQQMMKQVAHIRERLWFFLRWLHHMRVTARLDPRRFGSGHAKQEFAKVTQLLEEARNLQVKAKDIFKGLIPDRCFDHYLRERFETICEEARFCFESYIKQYPKAEQWPFTDQLKQEMEGDMCKML